MKAIRVKPAQLPEVIDVRNTLSDLQKEVDGHIEVIYPFDDSAAIVCNDEGKLLGLPVNRALCNDKGDVYDVLMGTFLIVGLTEDQMTDLTADQIETYLRLFTEDRQIWNIDIFSE